MAVRMKHLTTEWQVGDGREAALADYVVSHARRGDVGDAIRRGRLERARAGSAGHDRSVAEFEDLAGDVRGSR
jgi:hypothetical protein